MAVRKDQPNIHELDKKISIVSEIVNRMETNHLVHLKKDIDNPWWHDFTTCCHGCHFSHFIKLGE